MFAFHKDPRRRPFTLEWNSSCRAQHFDSSSRKFSSCQLENNIPNMSVWGEFPTTGDKTEWNSWKHLNHSCQNTGVRPSFPSAQCARLQAAGSLLRLPPLCVDLGPAFPQEKLQAVLEVASRYCLLQIFPPPWACYADALFFLSGLEISPVEPI